MVFTVGGTSGNRRIQKMVVTLGAADPNTVNVPAISGDATFDETTNVTITADEGATIYYTTDGNDPTTTSSVYSAPIAISATTTVKAIAVKDGNSSTVATATFTRVLPATGGTVDNPLTVVQAIEFIGTLGTATSKEVYVKGKVSTAPSANPSSAGKLTFYISDDGTTTNQLQAYSTLGLEKKAFTAKEDIKAGDDVVLCGKLKLFNTTKEMDNGYVYSKNGITTGINAVKAADATDAPAYNLAGQKVNQSYKGVVLKNGKKFVQK